MQYVHLNPDVARRLSELAKRTGRRPSEMIEEGIEGLENRYPAQAGVEGTPPSRDGRQARGEHSRARAAAWLEASKTFPSTPPLSDEAISRENIYGARG